MKKTDINQPPCYFDKYINCLENIELSEAFSNAQWEIAALKLDQLKQIGDSVYAEGKWTIKDIFQHLIDAERIFAYRALRFARNDKTALPGFDENEYVDATNSNKRSIQDLLTELAVVRQATLSLYKSFSEEELLRIGTASDNPMSVRALGFVIIGHQNHHQRVFEERYL